MEVSPSLQLADVQSLCLIVVPRLLGGPAVHTSELVLMHAVSSSLLQCDAR